VYELLGQAGQLDSIRQESLRIYNEGFEAYRGRQFEKAKACFEKVLKHEPEDGPAKAFLECVHRYMRDPPTLDWDGVFELKSK
ncbi:MAG TPA: tetratricopeptide repeat protein, partial [Nitrospira sp.]|nr:tetratricopeptide repeat protein [Nitrospira sp.]